MPPWRAMIWRRAPLLLGMALLFAQMVSLTHGASHSLEHGHVDDPVCAICLAAAPLAGGLVSGDVVFKPFSLPGPHEANPSRPYLDIAGLPPYLSRAPPPRLA